MALLHPLPSETRLKDVDDECNGNLKDVDDRLRLVQVFIQQCTMALYAAASSCPPVHGRIRAGARGTAPSACLVLLRLRLRLRLALLLRLHTLRRVPLEAMAAQICTRRQQAVRARAACSSALRAHNSPWCRSLGSSRSACHSVDTSGPRAPLPPALPTHHHHPCSTHLDFT